MYWDQVCAVVTDPTKGYAGISLLAIEAGTPGFACAKTVGKIGKLASDTCLMTMKNCRVRNVLDHFLRRFFLCRMHFFSSRHLFQNVADNTFIMSFIFSRFFFVLNFVCII